MGHKGHSDTTTEGIRVQVAAQYFPQQSDPDNQNYLFGYRVIVTNGGDRTAQLLSRHWIIVDALNNRQEVRGDGVVGEQPILRPGEKFEYHSSCPLNTSWGTMEGSYRMRPEKGDPFDISIGRFFLAPNVAPMSELDNGTDPAS